MGIVHCTPPCATCNDKFHPEISEEFFQKHFDSSQIPNNRAYSKDLQIYTIKSKDNDKSYVLRKIRFNDKSALKHMTYTMDKISVYTHPHFLRIDSYFTENITFKGSVIGQYLNIIHEDYSHTLYDEILSRKQNKQEFTTQEILKFIHFMVETNEFLQQHGIAYTHIKPTNIFYSKEEQQYRLCFLGENNEDLMDDLAGDALSSIRYFSPLIRMNLTASMINGAASYRL
jgi:hypothetical protein